MHDHQWYIRVEKQYVVFLGEPPMCNLYNIRGPLSNLANEMAANFQALFEFEETIYPKRQAPALILNENRKLEIVPMRFGLIPFGSTLEKTKRPFNNARVEKLDGWPWKLSVKRNRCAIPISSFFEFSYYENHAGHKLEFVAENTVLAAGIYSRFADGYSMTIVTRPGNEFVMEHGHHRMPLFIDSANHDWLDQGELSPKQCHDVLKRSAIEPSFEVEVHDKMKEGWQKRVDNAENKRAEQLDAIRETGPLGV